MALLAVLERDLNYKMHDTLQVLECKAALHNTSQLRKRLV